MSQVPLNRRVCPTCGAPYEPTCSYCGNVWEQPRPIFVDYGRMSLAQAQAMQARALHARPGEAIEYRPANYGMAIGGFLGGIFGL